MNINPFDDILAKKNQEVSNLSTDLKTINQELAWYEGTELTVLTCHHEALCLDLKKQSHECDQLSEKIEEKTSKYRDVSVSVKSIWNPKNWFDAEQRSLRSRANNLKNSLEQEKETLSKAQKKSQKISHGIQNKIEEIERYKDFDFNKKNKQREIIEIQLSQHKEQADIISHKKKQVDLVLEPIINQINNVEEEISEAYSGKQRALEFDEKLANADNSYERAMTHQACEDEFGEGSPRKIISKMESIIRRNERDLEKLHKRAHSIVEITVKTIEAKKLVIDGNNLCYESSNYFIGLEALLVVVPVLAEIYDVIVVFDASIRKALNCDDVEIHNKFGKNVNVHIVATKIKADETILDVASFDKTTLVISNDKYSDFSEKIAVAEQRVIRHEIVDGKIFIHALGVKICLGRNGQ